MRRRSRKKASAPLSARPDARENVGTILADNPIPFGFRLGYLANLFSGPIYKEMSATHGIGRPEWVILFCLGQFKTLSANDVRRMTGRAKANVSRAVHKLVQRDLVSRVKDPEDARSALLGLTAKGVRVYDETLPLFVERETQMLSVLREKEAAELDRLLARLTLRDDGWDVTY
jgi:DNA-binding MarR family transcriptional regulator